MKSRKFIQWTMAAVLSVVLPLFVTSCVTEDNPAKPTESKALITVNTADLYEQLILTEEAARWLERGWVIVDTVLIYDETGHLVTKLGAGTTTLDPLTIEASGLPNGTYTLVAFQTGVIDEDSAWKLDGEELLSTVNVTSIYSQLNPARVLGYASATVTVDGGTIEATVSPRPLGSVIDFWMLNLDESMGYKRVLVEGNHDKYVKGCYLDPSLSDAERRIKETEHDWNETICSFVPEGTNHHICITLSVDENPNFALWGQKEDGTYDFLSENAYELTAGQRVMYYVDMKKLSWQPSFFGTKEDCRSWWIEREAGILDFYPCLNWGCNVDEVRQYVQSKQYWANRYPEVTPTSSELYWVTSWFIAHRTAEEYLYTTAEGENMQKVYVRCFDTNLSLDQVRVSLIKQGYEYAGKVTFPEKAPRDILFSPDGVTEVQTYMKDSYVVIYYQPTDPDDFQYITPVEDEDEEGGEVDVRRRVRSQQTDTELSASAPRFQPAAQSNCDPTLIK